MASTTKVFEYHQGSLEGDDPLHGELMELNMGPQHPATHGVLRLRVVLDGETMREVEPDVGYLHRGKEKTCESLGWRKFFVHTDRLDYVQPLMNNVAYALALEKLAGLEVPERGQVIRVLLMELSRIGAHLIYLGTTAIDLGAVTMFFFTFKERETLYTLLDAYTGHRMNNTYVRIGGVYADVEDEVGREIGKWLEHFLGAVDEFESMLSGNRIWFDRNRDIGVISKELALAWSLTGPNLRGSGYDFDLRNLLVAAEVSLAVVLLIGASLMAAGHFLNRPWALSTTRPRRSGKSTWAAQRYRAQEVVSAEAGEPAR